METLQQVTATYFGVQASGWLDDPNWMFRPTPRAWASTPEHGAQVIAFVQKLIRQRRQASLELDRRAVQALGRYTDAEMDLQDPERGN